MFGSASRIAAHGRRDLRGLAARIVSPVFGVAIQPGGHVGAGEQRVLVIHLAVEEVGGDADDREPLVAGVRIRHLESRPSAS